MPRTVLWAPRADAGQRHNNGSSLDTTVLIVPPRKKKSQGSVSGKELLVSSSGRHKDTAESPAAFILAEKVLQRGGGDVRLEQRKQGKAVYFSWATLRKLT